MQVSTNIDKLQKSLDQFVVDNERKLRKVVINFAVQLAENAINQTPIGSDESIRINDKYRSLYEQRANLTGLPTEAGYHRGSWMYSEDEFEDFFPFITEPADALGNVDSDARSMYNLGDSFNIKSVGPAIVQLENNYSEQTQGQGIVNPTFAAVESAFSIDSKQNYDNG
jgi:hypothetical protein